MGSHNKGYNCNNVLPIVTHITEQSPTEGSDNPQNGEGNGKTDDEKARENK